MIVQEFGDWEKPFAFVEQVMRGLPSTKTSENGMGGNRWPHSQVSTQKTTTFVCFALAFVSVETPLSLFSTPTPPFVPFSFPPFLKLFQFSTMPDT
ncbi:hypothetical protein RJT34_31905 [Clitoria ternatea]|uniref:Uncharacterized protein n=1 Tax=Clitoria ternatea TaxID=43366 RepID=A0AAN9EWQ1_CLITE